jgi:hypothetical protein
MDLIFTHRSGGRLWQGDKNDVKRLLRRPSDQIALIGLFAQEIQPSDPNSHYELLKSGFDDNGAADANELKKVAEVADSASDKFASALREGKGCLSSCQMGLNRSGLVSALTLIKVAGLSPKVAIDLIRMSRVPQEGFQALCNAKFVELIHQMGPASGSKSAWTKWGRESPKEHR